MDLEITCSLLLNSTESCIGLVAVITHSVITHQNKNKNMYYVMISELFFASSYTTIEIGIFEGISRFEPEFYV